MQRKMIAALQVSLVLSVVLGSVAGVVSMLLLSLAMMGALAYDGPFWASASRAVRSPFGRTWVPWPE